MKDITEHDFETMSHEELVEMFVATMQEIGDAMERATHTIARQNGIIETQELQIRELKRRLELKGEQP
jgi:hypothetical protein